MNWSIMDSPSNMHVTGYMCIRIEQDYMFNELRSCLDALFGTFRTDLVNGD